MRSTVMLRIIVNFSSLCISLLLKEKLISSWVFFFFKSDFLVYRFGDQRLDRDVFFEIP